MKKLIIYSLFIVTGCASINKEHVSCENYSVANFVHVEDGECSVYRLQGDDFRMMVSIENNSELPDKFQAKYNVVSEKNKCGLDAVVFICQVIP